jgi:putative nucleotidyltransferase with HDIG domain
MDLEAVVSQRVKTASLRVPPSPVVALRLSQLLKDERSTVAGLASVVKQDQSLAAVVLRLANSAAYRRTSEVIALASAVVVLGRKALVDVAYSHAVHEQTVRSGSLLPLRRRAWRESLVAAQVSFWVAELFDVDADAAYVGGLLHDIGRVPMIGLLEELLIEHPEADTRTEDGWWSLLEAFHVEAGVALASSWGLPGPVLELIRAHHGEGEGSKLLEVVRIADDVVRLLDGESCVPPERLGTIAALSSGQCLALALSLPLLPGYLDAFREPAVSELAEVIDYELRLSEALDVGLHVTLHVGGLVFDAPVYGLDPVMLSVRRELRPGQLVRVRAGAASFHARVAGCRSGITELTPWALDEAQQQAWLDFIAKGQGRLAA